MKAGTVLFDDLIVKPQRGVRGLIHCRIPFAEASEGRILLEVGRLNAE